MRSTPARVEIVGGRKSGDASADDDDALAPRQLYSLNSRTISTQAFTFSTGVSGRMPWPRLKMWPGPRAGALQQLMHAHAQLGKRSEQHRRIQIALHRRPVADVHPGLVDVDAPVDAHHVAAGGVQLAEKARRAGAEVDHRNARRANALDQRARIRRHVANVIVRPQRAHPAIEHLNDARARGHLQHGERAQHVHQLAHQAAPQRLVAIHHLLGLEEIARRPAFDHVARHGERRADESDHRNASGQRRHHLLNRFADVAQIVGVRNREAVDVVRSPHRIVDHRPFARGEAQLQAHRLHRQQQIGENDGRVDVQNFHRLQRHLGRQIGALADFQDPVLLRGCPGTASYSGRPAA